MTMSADAPVTAAEWHEAKLRVAYQLWEEAGHPWGRDHEFWDAAEEIMKQRQSAADIDGQAVTSVT